MRLVAGLLALLPVLAAAEPERRFEVFAAVHHVEPRLDTTYTTRFTANLGEGGGGQTLTVLGEPGAMGSVGVGWFPRPRLGLRLTIGREAVDLGGVNPPYAWQTRVTTRQPPDYVPRDFTYADSHAWPDTSGRLKVHALSVDGVWRWGAGRRLSGSVSGGLTALRVSAELQALGLTTFHLGGHSTLFPVDYELGLTTRPQTTPGVQLGTDVELALGSRVGVRLGVRVLRAPSFDAPIEVLQVRNPEEIVLATPIDGIMAILDPEPLTLDPSSTQIHVGLVLWP